LNYGFAPTIQELNDLLYRRKDLSHDAAAMAGRVATGPMVAPISPNMLLDAANYLDASAMLVRSMASALALQHGS
jgi:hypothetical protein